jgi:hypothetical protein
LQSSGIVLALQKENHIQGQGQIICCPEKFPPNLPNVCWSKKIATDLSTEIQAMPRSLIYRAEHQNGLAIVNQRDFRIGREPFCLDIFSDLPLIIPNVNYGSVYKMMALSTIEPVSLVSRKVRQSSDYRFILLPGEEFEASDYDRRAIHFRDNLSQ